MEKDLKSPNCIHVGSMQGAEILWQRAIYWTFAVINMLPGVNMPINYQG